MSGNLRGYWNGNSCREAIEILAPTFPLFNKYKFYYVIIIIIKSEEWRVPCDIKNVDIDVEVVEEAIQSDCWCVTNERNQTFAVHICMKLLYSDVNCKNKKTCNYHIFI